MLSLAKHEWMNEWMSQTALLKLPCPLDEQFYVISHIPPYYSYILPFLIFTPCLQGQIGISFSDVRIGVKQTFRTGGSVKIRVARLNKIVSNLITV